MRRQHPEEQSAWLKDVFESLDAQAIAKLQDAGEPVTLQEGDVLPPVRDVVVRVETGLLKLAVTSDERRLTLAVFGPNDTIVSPLFHSWPTDQLYHIEAQEDSQVWVIPQSAVLEVAAKNAEFSAALMRQLSWANWQFMDTVHMLAFYNLPQRVAQVLVNLAAIFGIRDEKRGIRLGLRFTQEELAELAGARRETLSTVLQDFREEGILDLRYARIDIRDIEGLRRLAGTEPLPYLSLDRIATS